MKKWAKMIICLATALVSLPGTISAFATEASDITYADDTSLQS